MPVQSLGIFDKVFSWVYKKLLSPVIEWLADILGNIFEWIFDNILMGFLSDVFDLLWDHIGVKIANWFFAGIYRLYISILSLVDCLQYCFDVLIGLQDIKYIDADGVEQSSTLLNYIIFNDTIRTALISITFIAFVLTVIFAIYSMMKSSFDFDFENKRPVGKVLAMTLKTMMTFLFIPLIIWVGLNLASVVLKQTAVALSTQNNGNISIGDTILMVSASKAHPSGAGFSMQAEPWSRLADGTLNYITFATEINIAEIDYLVGFASAIFCMIIMAMCLLSFIRRIYDIVLLYIVSPYFASTMVLDDGQKFSQWRETFIGKVLIGFGSALGMRLFLMLIPVIMSEDIRFFDNSLTEATAGYILKLILILGGMYAVYKSSSLLTSIISSSVAQDEQMSNSLMMHRFLSVAERGGKKLGKSALNGIRSMHTAAPALATAAALGAKGNAFRDASASGAVGMNTGSLKINGAKGADADQSSAWKRSISGLDADSDYQQKPNAHISDVEDMSAALHNMFDESGDMDGLSKNIAANSVEADDMGDSLRNLFAEGNDAAVSVNTSDNKSDILRVSGTERVDTAAVSSDGFGDDLLANAVFDDYIQTPDAPAIADITQAAVFDDYNAIPDAPEIRDITAGVDVFEDYIGTPAAPPLRDITEGATIFEDYTASPAAPDLRDITEGATIFEDYTAAPATPSLKDITDGVTVFDDYVQTPKAPAIMDLTNSVRDDYSRHDHGGVSTLGIGSKVFSVPEGYTAFPKLVPEAKAQSRINTMKVNAESRFSSYYDAMSSSADNGGYKPPRVMATAGDSFSSLTKVNGVEMNIPKGYTVVPEIMKISDAQTAAEQYGKGKNARFYSEFSSSLVTHSFNEATVTKTAAIPSVSANQIAELEAGIFGTDTGNKFTE